MAKAKAVDVAVIEKARKALVKAAPKEPAALPVALALEKLKPEIEAAIGKGYSRAEVAAMLAEVGVEVKEYQIKALFKQARKPKAEAAGEAQ